LAVGIVLAWLDGATRPICCYVALCECSQGMFNFYVLYVRVIAIFGQIPTAVLLAYSKA